MRLASLAFAAGAALTTSAMTSADATIVLLNSKSAVSVERYAAAKEIVERDAEEGRPLQQFVIGVTTDDKQLAERYLTQSRDKIYMMASMRNNPMAWYLLSVEQNDMSYLRKAADGGNVQALNALGTILMQDAIARETSTNALAVVFRQCYDYFNQAARQRDPNAFINLGSCYLRGYGCRRDPEMAFRCFRFAAEAGHPEGMDSMSNCYKYGYGVKRDEERSLYWMMLARELRGDKAAAKWLRERK